MLRYISNELIYIILEFINISYIYFNQLNQVKFELVKLCLEKNYTKVRYELYKINYLVILVIIYIYIVFKGG